MNKSVNNLIFKTTEKLDPEKRQLLLKEFKTSTDLELFFEGDYRIVFTYNPYLYAPEFIKSKLSDLNIKEKPEEKKGLFRSFIEKLSKENHKSAEDGALNCCSHKSKKTN